MSRGGRWALAGAGLAVAAALLVPAAADWLVTRGGDRIETAGPWRVENRLVVFKRPDGSYASLRLSEIDLEASERLTRELAERARSPRPEPAPEPRGVVARLTEKELPPVAREEAPAGAGTGAAEAGAPPGGEEPGPEPGTEAGAEALQIVTWRELGGPERTGLEFVGDVRNLTDHTALGVTVTVVLLDEAGEEAASADALVTASSLPPGSTAGFRASFPGVFRYAGVQFRAAADLVLSQDGQRDEGEPPPLRR